MSPVRGQPCGTLAPPARCSSSASDSCAARGWRGGVGVVCFVRGCLAVSASEPFEAGRQAVPFPSHPNSPTRAPKPARHSHRRRRQRLAGGRLGRGQRLGAARARRRRRREAAALLRRVVGEPRELLDAAEEPDRLGDEAQRHRVEDLCACVCGVELCLGVVGSMFVMRVLRVGVGVVGVLGEAADSHTAVHAPTPTRGNNN